MTAKSDLRDFQDAGQQKAASAPTAVQNQEIQSTIEVLKSWRLGDEQEQKETLDVILAAQAFSLGDRAEDVVIATTNVAHLEQFFVAKHWKDIDYSAPSQV